MMNIKINGLQENQEKLKQLQNAVAGDVLYKSLMSASTDMYKRIRANAPYLTGKIRANIRRRRLTKGYSANLQGASIAIYVHYQKPRDSSAYYYIFHEEYGARGRPPKPFIRPAFVAGNQAAADKFNEQTIKRIEKIWASQ